MKADQARKLRYVSWQTVETALFFLLFYLYLWLVVDPRLIHHSLGLLTDYSGFAFSDGWPFLQEHLARPGGLVEYLAGFLSQLFSFGWVGALIVTGAAWSLCLFVDLLTRQAGLSRGVVVRYVPAAVLLVMYGRYHHPISTIVSLLAGLSCFALYVYGTPKGTLHRLLVLLVTVTAAYHVAGAGSLVFPILAAAYELLIGRRTLLALAALLCGLSVPWLVGSLRFGLSLGNAYGQFLLADPGLARTNGSYGLGLLAFFPLLLAGAVLGRAGLGRRSSRESPLAARSRGASGRAAQTVIVLASIGVVAWFSLHVPVRTVLEMDADSQQEKWAQVLEAAERMPRGQYSVRCNRNTMLALYHTGRLGDEMFRYPQIRGMSPFGAPEGGGDHGALFQESRLYFYLGQINYAEKCAYDALGVAGDVPEVLEHLALISVVRGRLGAAHVLLSALGKNPFYRATATEMLRRLEDDPQLQGDPRVSGITSLLPDADSFTRTINVEDVLLALLNNSRQNRMAFEFLMARYLAIGRPEKVAEQVGRLRDLGYGEMPRHYQEALLICLGPEAAKLRAAPYEMQREVLQEFESFTAIVRREPDGQAAARDALAAGLGDTYFFFLTFGHSVP